MRAQHAVGSHVHTHTHTHTQAGLLPRIRMIRTKEHLPWREPIGPALPRLQSCIEANPCRQLTLGWLPGLLCQANRLRASTSAASYLTIVGDHDAERLLCFLSSGIAPLSRWPVCCSLPCVTLPSRYDDLNDSSHLPPSLACHLQRYTQQRPPRAPSRLRPTHCPPALLITSHPHPLRAHRHHVEQADGLLGGFAVPKGRRRSPPPHHHHQRLYAF